MAFNNGFPATYQNPYAYAFQQQAQQQMQQAQMQQAPQMMTPPTIHAEIVQVANEAAGEQFPVGVGASQMMITRDERTIMVKSASQNGVTVEYYDKREPAPPARQIAPEDIVTWEALEQYMADRAKPKAKKKEEPAE